MYNDDDKSTMMNREIERRRRWRGARGGWKKRLIDARSLVPFITRFPRVVQRSTSAFTLPQVVSVYNHPPLLLFPAKERARRRNRATRIRNNGHGTHHQVQAKKKKKKKKEACLVAGWLAWLAGSTILVWMTANDFPPRFPVADSRGLRPKCRLTRAH